MGIVNIVRLLQGTHSYHAGMECIHNGQHYWIIKRAYPTSGTVYSINHFRRELLTIVTGFTIIRSLNSTLGNLTKKSFKGNLSTGALETSETDVSDEENIDSAFLDGQDD